MHVRKVCNVMISELSESITHIEDDQLAMQHMCYAGSMSPSTVGQASVVSGLIILNKISVDQSWSHFDAYHLFLVP